MLSLLAREEETNKQGRNEMDGSVLNPLSDCLLFVAFKRMGPSLLEEGRIPAAGAARVES